VRPKAKGAPAGDRDPTRLSRSGRPLEMTGSRSWPVRRVGWRTRSGETKFASHGVPGMHGKTTRFDSCRPTTARARALTPAMPKALALPRAEQASKSFLTLLLPCPPFWANCLDAAFWHAVGGAAAAVPAQVPAKENASGPADPRESGFCADGPFIGLGLWLGLVSDVCCQGRRRDWSCGVSVMTGLIIESETAI
jgi:hypothetical protein